MASDGSLLDCIIGIGTNALSCERKVRYFQEEGFSGNCSLRIFNPCFFAEFLQYLLDF
jgi:hypothetical protein